MLSRVSNERVLDTASARPLADQLIAKQLLLFGKVALMPDTSIVRKAVFRPSSTQLAKPAGVRKRGRPRVSWGCKARMHALRAAGGDENRLTTALDRSSGCLKEWRAIVRQYSDIAL